MLLVNFKKIHKLKSTISSPIAELQLHPPYESSPVIYSPCKSHTSTEPLLDYNRRTSYVLFHLEFFWHSFFTNILLIGESISPLYPPKTVSSAPLFFLYTMSPLHASLTKTKDNPILCVQYCLCPSDLVRKG